MMWTTSKGKDGIRGKIVALILALVCSACAHPIKIAPDLAELKRDAGPAGRPGEARIQKNVGYYISDADRERRVETPGGGGDKVSYTPYADLEAGIHRVLSSIFAKVSVIKETPGPEVMKANGINYIFTPSIRTGSSSRNIMFWPPTDFTVTIECSAVDSTGAQIWSQTVSADGGLTSVNSTIHEHGLAGRRAAENALKKLQAAIVEAPAFRGEWR
jgi:hypothetical protein